MFAGEARKGGVDMIAVVRGVKGVNVTKMCSYEMWEQLEDMGVVTERHAQGISTNAVP